MASMKRQIIFRGKRLDNGEWVEGSLIQWGDGGMSIVAQLDTHSGIQHTAYRDTVGQWTGLTDRNGQRIFEGDILRVTEYENLVVMLSLDKTEIGSTPLEDCKYQKRVSFIGEVVFSESCFHVGNTYLSAFHGDQRFSQPIFEIEVVGNVWDNKDLLKTE